MTTLHLISKHFLYIFKAYLIILRAFFSLISVIALSTFSHADMVYSDDYEPWETCALCHGYSGDSAMAKFPKLNGQKANYLEKQIRDFQKGVRANDGGQMSEMVSELNGQDIQAIVAWFSSQDHPSYAEPSTMLEQERNTARQLVYEGGEDTPACVQCHVQTNESIPWIKGQHAAYIEKQLLDFKEEERTNDSGVMHQIASQLSDSEIELISQYLSSAQRDVASR